MTLKFLSSRSDPVFISTFHYFSAFPFYPEVIPCLSLFVLASATLSVCILQKLLPNALQRSDIIISPGQ